MLSGNIVKVTNTPAGVPEPPEQTVLVRQWPDSSAVPRVGVSIDSAGVLTITDRLNGTWLRDSGLRSRSEGKSTLVLSTNSGGSFYGAGERGHKLNLRGDTLVNYNRQNYGYTGDDQRISQMNITMPVLLSSDGFALLFDDFAASTMVASDSIVYTTESDLPVTYYYIGGVHSLAELTTALTSLTGRQPLPPFWAMGYITSKYGYKSPEETVAAVDSLRGQGYPLDGIVLDLYWFGREQDMGFLDWDRSVWPDPEGMMRRLADRGVKLITVSEPYILRNGTGIDNYNTLDADSMMVRDSIGATHPVTIWVGEGGMFDVSNPKTRRWLGDRYRMLTDLGVGGWWGDLGEPEVHPETGFHANGLGARKYHNHYGNDWSSIISELYAEHYPDRRLITLMRGGTTGLQRHSVFPWSTDVSRSWGGLEPQIRIMLNSGLSGLGYMSSDLGGFASTRPIHICRSFMFAGSRPGFSRLSSARMPSSSPSRSTIRSITVCWCRLCVSAIAGCRITTPWPGRTRPKAGLWRVRSISASTATGVTTMSPTNIYGAMICLSHPWSRKAPCNAVWCSLRVASGLISTTLSCAMPAVRKPS